MLSPQLSIGSIKLVSTAPLRRVAHPVVALWLQHQRDSLFQRTFGISISGVSALARGLEMPCVCCRKSDLVLLSWLWEQMFQILPPITSAPLCSESRWSPRTWF